VTERERFEFEVEAAGEGEGELTGESNGKARSAWKEMRSQTVKIFTGNISFQLEKLYRGKSSV
jgi:hypothetical protein